MDSVLLLASAASHFGGGLSPFSRCYGLASDNLLEMTIVTASGEIVTVSRDHEDKQKCDLFWALTGGGGGNFGVTVSMTCKIHSLRDSVGIVTCGNLTWNLPQQEREFGDMMDAFNSTECPQELTIDALWTHGKNKQLTGGMTVIYNGNETKAREALKYLTKFNPIVDDLQAMHWVQWEHKAEGWDPFSEVHHHHSSFMFAEGAVTRELNSTISGIVTEAVELLGITNGNGPNDPKCHVLWDHIGAATTQVGAEDTAFFWRTGHYVSTIKVQWKDPSQGNKMLDFLLKCKTKLLPYAIEKKAAYLNYIDGTVSNWQEAYYGNNYPRLQEIKSQWDPNNFFRNMQSVEPLKKGAAPRTVHGEHEVPTLDQLAGTSQVKQVRSWWNEYAALAMPDSLGSPKTKQEVFERDCKIRRVLLRNAAADSMNSS